MNNLIILCTQFPFMTDTQLMPVGIILLKDLTYVSIRFGNVEELAIDL